MFEYTVNAILDTPTWRDAAGLAQHSPFPPSHDDLKKEQQYRSWLRAVSKHLRILEAVRGVAEANENSAFPAQFDPLQLPFHPIHCAASQGMTRAGKLLLQRCSGNGNNQVRGCFVLEQRVWVHVGGVFLFFSISGPIHPQFTSTLETCVLLYTSIWLDVSEIKTSILRGVANMCRGSFQPPLQRPLSANVEKRP